MHRTNQCALVGNGVCDVRNARESLAGLTSDTADRRLRQRPFTAYRKRRDLDAVHVLEAVVSALPCVCGREANPATFSSTATTTFCPRVRTMHPVTNLRLCKPGIRPLHMSSASRAGNSSRPGNMKFVRSQSTSAKTEAPNATKTTKKLEATLRERAKRGDHPSEVEKEFMPWGEYLSVRKNKRRWETVRIAHFHDSLRS